MFDLYKPIYAKYKEDGVMYLVDSIHFPLGKPNGKDVAVLVEEDLCEWRGINDIELIQRNEVGYEKG